MAPPKSAPGGVDYFKQQLPPDFVAILVGLYATGRRRDQPDYATFTAVLDAAHRKGWTYVALARALDLTRERVRQRLLEYVGLLDGVELPAIPDPPRRPPAHPRYDRRHGTSISDGMKAWLADMYRTAKTVTGAVALDDPRRGVSEAFSAVLADLQDRGVSAGTIAKAVGCHPRTVYFRLRRHGYRHNAPSQKPYRRMVTPNVAMSIRRIDMAPGERFEAWLNRQAPTELGSSS